MRAFLQAKLDTMIRALMQRAAITHHVDLHRLSFKGTLDSLAHFANAIQASSNRPRARAAQTSRAAA
jgi:hypothetical protein